MVSDALSVIRITDTVNKRKVEHNFTVCVSPLFGPITERHLVEWMEHHRMIGVNKFVFYNQSIQDQDLERRLHMYRDMRLVDILPWNIPHGR